MEKNTEKELKQEEWEQSVQSYLENNDVGEAHYDTFCFIKGKDENTEEQGNPDNMGILEVRTLMTDMNNDISKQSKFMGIQQFQNFGDLATIDIVRLPKDMHRDMLSEYLNFIISGDADYSNPLSQDPYYSGLILAGGHFNKESNQLKFGGSSGDFRDLFGMYNINNLASYLISQSEVPFESPQQDQKQGEKYVNNLLGFMSNNKLKSDFYERLADFYVFDGDVETYNLSANMGSALVNMKARDRAKRENSNILQTLTEEITSGDESMSTYLMAKSFAMKSKK